jgi:hypothetical protein
MVVALLALFVALTGTATATTVQLINGKQILNGSITGLDIKNKSIGKKKLVGNFQGPVGPPGPAGPAGPAPDTSQFYKKTETDARYLRGTVTVVTASGLIANNGFGNATATCPAGHQVLGGGGDPLNVSNMYITGSYPMANNADRPYTLADAQYGPATQWRVWFRNESGANANGKAVAVCAPIG